MMHRGIVALLAIALLTACTTLPTPAARRQAADMLAATRGWQASLIPAGKFDLVAYAPQRIERDNRLTVYIEGDGLAWLSPSLPSHDPTPLDPLALRLALAHPAGNAAYLGRPCQYVDAAARHCEQRYWTEQRFAPEVIEAAGNALDMLKQRFDAQRLTLVGYSGGAAVAALLAARRDDVERLVTVAGNLDHKAWTTHHRVAELKGSLNPAEVAERLAHLPQVHFIGARDRVIPPRLARNFPGGLRGDEDRNLRIMQQYDHVCCWEENWRELWNKH